MKIRGCFKALHAEIAAAEKSGLPWCYRDIVKKYEVIHQSSTEEMRIKCDELSQLLGNE